MVKTGSPLFVPVIILCNFELQIGCRTFFPKLNWVFSFMITFQPASLVLILHTESI